MFSPVWQAKKRSHSSSKFTRLHEITWSEPNYRGNQRIQEDVWERYNSGDLIQHNLKRSVFESFYILCLCVILVLKKKVCEWIRSVILFNVCLKAALLILRLLTCNLFSISLSVLWCCSRDYGSWGWGCTPFKVEAEATPLTWDVGQLASHWYDVQCLTLIWCTVQ